jgi:hypothetical protein
VELLLLQQPIFQAILSYAAPIGEDKIMSIDFGASGMAVTALNTATTIVCPGATGVIWRINVAYRLGL